MDASYLGQINNKVELGSFEGFEWYYVMLRYAALCNFLVRPSEINK